LRISGLMVLLIIALAPATRSLFENGFEFINNFSYPVSVHPLEHDWGFFDLDPGAIRTPIAALLPPWL
jgi:hypothetical protein